MKWRFYVNYETGLPISELMTSAFMGSNPVSRTQSSVNERFGLLASLRTDGAVAAAPVHSRTPVGETGRNSIPMRLRDSVSRSFSYSCVQDTSALELLL